MVRNFLTRYEIRGGILCTDPNQGDLKSGEEEGLCHEVEEFADESKVRYVGIVKRGAFDDLEPYLVRYSLRTQGRALYFFRIA